MSLSATLITEIGAAGITVSEWLLKPTSGQLSAKPPYAVVCGTGTNAIYANGAMVIECEQVSVHLVYRQTVDDEAVRARLDAVLRPHGYVSKTEQVSADRVLVKTYDLEGG